MRYSKELVLYFEMHCDRCYNMIFSFLSDNEMNDFEITFCSICYARSVYVL